MKMNPPLRSKEDLAAIKQGLREGIIDAIASDHAPHTENEKDIEFERAEFGVVGLETELAVSITELINNKVLDWPELIRRFCLNPARILGLERGQLALGSFADVIIISDQSSWTVDKQALVSKSKNSSFLGRSLKGWVDYTICNGTIVYQR